MRGTPVNVLGIALIFYLKPAPACGRILPVNNIDSLASPTPNPARPLRVAVLGGGPAGLMAAEALASAGLAVSVRV
jgi:threonine dehydrogenase-like Zn-dependent dehydrogenase